MAAAATAAAKRAVTATIYCCFTFSCAAAAAEINAAANRYINEKTKKPLCLRATDCRKATTSAKPRRTLERDINGRCRCDNILNAFAPFGADAFFVRSMQRYR